MSNSNSFNGLKEDFFKSENKKIILMPVQIIAALTIIAGIYALLFELRYYEDFQLKIYWGRLLATLIGFFVFATTYTKYGKKHPEILVHVLLLAIIGSFISVIIIIPETLFVNSQVLSLVIFTSAIFLSWDLKNQIIVAIYYNLLFAYSILGSEYSIFFLPNIFSTLVFIMFVSIMSIFANAINYNLRKKVLKKTLEAKEIFENSSEGLFRINSDLEILTHNPSFLQILNLNEKHKIQYMNDFIHDEEIEFIKQKISQKTSIVKHKINLTKPDTHELFISLSLKPNTLKGHEKIWDGSIANITAQVIADKKISDYTHKLEKLNKNKDEFFSIISHDLKSPFTAVLGYSELLTRELEGNEELKNFAKNINITSKEAYNLLDNLLNWSRIQSDRMQFSPIEFNIIDAVNDVLGNLKRKIEEKNITVINEISENNFVVADLDMVYLILNNLISNAVKFNKKNGKIRFRNSHKDGFLIINIEDTGCGIDNEFLADLTKIEVHITKKARSKDQGSGLGLIIAKELIEKNSGKLFVKSKVDVGSVFSFSLPIKEQK